MTDAPYDDVVRLFHAALDQPAEARLAFVQAAATDDAVRERVRRMLEHDAASGAALETPGAEIAAAVLRDAFVGTAPAPAPSSDDGWMPSRLGTYQVRRKIADGGMGSVYEAEQAHPRRTVAVKTLRDTMSTAALRARFEREIRLLARLSHPGIARILDAGVADTERGPLPYFAMEYVSGAPIVDAATARGWSVRERLDVIANVCDAVQYAHQRGVIHRDLKPANILVEDDGTRRGQVKVLDFGVARATEVEDDEPSVATMGGQLIGTLPYMSPEQVRGARDAIDTRTDVYSLGVVLYELLGGAVPLDVRSRSIHEAARVICETDPPALGVRDRALRGEIETIVATALEKDPARRYASASEFAADLRRYLRDEPIAARPATTFYQLRKFARRHTALVTGIAVAVAALILATALSARWALRAERATAAETDAKLAAQERELAMRWLSYRTGIQAVHALAERDPVGARALLDDLPEEHRHWEWWQLAEQLGRPLEPIDGVTAGWDRTGALLALRHTGSTLEVVDVATGAVHDVITGIEDARSARILNATPVITWRDAEAGRVMVHDVAARRTIGLVTPPDGGTITMAPDGRTYASTTAEGTAVTIGTIDAEGARVTIGTPATVEQARWDADARRLAVTTERAWAIFDAGTGERLTPWIEAPPRTGLDFAPDGTQVATWHGASESIRLYDAATGAALRTIDAHDGGVTRVVFSADGGRLASRGLDQRTRLWDLDPVREIASIVSGRGMHLHFSPDGASVLVDVERAGRRLVRWHWPERAASQVLRGHPQYVYAVACSPDGSHLATGDWDGTVRLWSRHDGAPRAVLPSSGDGHVISVAFSPDGATVFAALGEFNATSRLRAWSIPSAEPIEVDDPALSASARLERFLASAAGGTVGARFNGGAFVTLSPDRRFVAMAHRAEEIEITDRATDTLHRRIELPDGAGAIQSMAFDHPARRLAASTGDGFIRVIDIETATIVQTMDERVRGSYALAFTPDGRRLASGGVEHEIMIWDVATGARVALLTGHTGYVQALTFTPDGADLISGSGDATVRLWRSVVPAER